MKAGSSTSAVLVAAPGMTSREIEKLSTVEFKRPGDQEEKGLIQPRKPHRVLFRHEKHGFEVPASRFTLVDLYRGTATRVTATPQLDYLAVEKTVELVRLVATAIEKAGWEWLQSPDYDVLLQELPKRKGEVLLGEWRLGSWMAELRVYQALEAESVEARIAGLPKGGFLTTVVVWDQNTLR